MSERSTTAALARMLADEIEANNTLEQALTDARAATVNASASGLREICRLDALLWQTAEEARALGAEIDWLEAEWAYQITYAAKTWSEHFNRLEERAATTQSRLNTNQGLLDRIAEMEALDRQAVIRADEQASEIARLEKELEGCRHLIEHSRLEVLEANRLRIAAFERNAELERKIQAAVNALQEIAANELLSGNVLGVLSYLRGPRRDEPGTEVMA
jgi:hypothetical protein